MKHLPLCFLVFLGCSESTGQLADAGQDAGQSAPDTPSDTGGSQDAAIVDGIGLDADGLDATALDVGSSFNPSDFALQVAEAGCSYFTRCAPAYFPFNRVDQAGCIASRSALLGAFYGDLRGALETGRTVFEESVARECVASFATADCITEEVDEVCLGAFVGRQGATDPCARSIECISGQYCTAAVGQCGACSPLLEKDATCAANGACAPGLSCLSPPSGGAFRCAPVNLEEGETCGTLETGLCGGALSCVERSQQTGAGFCRRPKELGESCSTTMDVAPCSARRALACEATKCTEHPYALEGEACGLGVAFCTTGLRCDNTLCVSLPKDGEACERGRCAPGLYCAGSVVCVAKRDVGGDCQTSIECSTGLGCVIENGQGKCTEVSWALCE